jgi:tetratricopeptide (TPR) repeat protein
VHTGLVAVLLLALVAGYWTRVSEPRAGALAQDLNERRYPIRTVEFMKRERVPGPLFNVYVWGGYELWGLYPDYRVFFDGRTHVYGEAIVREYLDVTLLNPRWRSVLDRWQIQAVLTFPNYPLTQALYESREWRLAFVDHEALLFVRNTPAHEPLFARIGPVRRPGAPPGVRSTLDAAVRAAERGQHEAAIRGFRRVLALDGGNPVALYSLGLLLNRRGERQEAVRLWQELQRTSPGSELAAKAGTELDRLRPTVR